MVRIPSVDAQPVQEPGAAAAGTSPRDLDLPGNGNGAGDRTRPAADAEAVYQQGVSSSAAGRIGEALSYFRQALRMTPGHAGAWTELGLVCARQRRLQAAEVCFRRAMAVDQQTATTHNHLGVTLQQLGRISEAAACYNQALTLQPDYAEPHYNLGNLARSGKHFTEAADHYRAALRLKPRAAEIHNHLGLALQGAQEFEAAVVSFREAVRLNPGLAEAHNNLGVTLQQLGKLEEATACFRKSLDCRPDAAGVSNNLGLVLRQLGQRAEAVEQFRKTVHLQPNYAEAHNNLGVALRDLGRLQEAVASYRDALQFNPDYPEALNNLGNALRDLGENEEACASLRRAIQVRSGYAEAHNNLGIVLHQQGKYAEAMASYEEALRLRPEYPEAHLNRALSWLGSGDWPRGWPEYEWRWRLKDIAVRRFSQPAWDGRSLGGRTILVYSEQGLGDTIQFVRLLPLVRQHGGKVLLECQSELFRLLAGCSGVDQIVARGQALPAFDVHAALLSLPGLLGATVDTVRADVPYLSADSLRVREWRKRLQTHTGLRIGIVWQGSQQYKGDRHRSVSLASFEPLAQLPGVRLFSLQFGPGRDQLKGWDRYKIIDLQPEMAAADGGFLETAAVIANLHLVISVDTAVAHLAGALAAPVWVALPFACDWRWLRDGEETSWYPTMRLFRQKSPGGWSDVFQRMAEALEREREKLSSRQPLAAEPSPGEILDRIGALEVCRQRIAERLEGEAIDRDLSRCRAAGARIVNEPAELVALAGEFRTIHEAIWNATEAMHRAQRSPDSGLSLNELARKVATLSQQRDDLKHRVDALYWDMPAALGTCTG
jgi:tetratricopeptide (TPR) repeat protein